MLQITSHELPAGISENKSVRVASWNLLVVSCSFKKLNLSCELRIGI